MINNTNDITELQADTADTKKPDDTSAIYVRGFVKITDPESGEVIVETNN